MRAVAGWSAIGQERNTRSPRKHSSEKVLLNSAPPIEKYFIGIKLLALTIGVSERTLFRLIKDNEFPRLKIGRKLLFHKESVIAYISTKYGVYFF
jgi:excisionase family DNA binding protein